MSRGALLGLLLLCGCPPATAERDLAPAAPVSTRAAATAERSPGPAVPTLGEGPVARVLKPKGFAYPRAVTVAPSGDVYVVDKAGWIRRFDREGRLLARVRAPDVSRGTPSGIAWSPHAGGQVLVADSHQSRVLVYGPQLRLRTTWGQAGRAAGSLMLVTDVAVDPQGRVYLTDQGDDVARVQVFDARGEHLRSFGSYGTLPGELKRPMSVAIDAPRGRLAVADALNHRVQLFTLAGEHLQEIGYLGEGEGELKYPYGVAFDASGRLFVADFGNHRLQVFDAQGAFLAELGGPGRAVGKLNAPWGVACGGGRVYLTDPGNDRCYELRPAVLLAN